MFSVKDNTLNAPLVFFVCIKRSAIYTKCLYIVNKLDFISTNMIYLYRKLISESRSANMIKGKFCSIALLLVLAFMTLFALSGFVGYAEDGVRRWDFTSADPSVLDDFTVVNENSEEYELLPDGLHFAVNTGDISGTRTDVQNLFLTEVSGSYTLEAHIELEKAWSSPNQACLVVFDSHGDFVKLGFQGNTVALCYAKDTVRTDGFAQATLGSSTKEVWLRLEKKNDDYAAYYSLNGVNYTRIGGAKVELEALKAGFFVGWNGYNGTAPVDVWFDYFSVTSTEAEVLPVDKTIVPNKETIKLEYGKSFALSVESTDAATDVGEITYESSDDSIATVSDSGVITAVGDGYATITVRSEYSGKCTVVVSALPAYREYVSVANPYMPVWEYVPDAEPYVFEDPDNPGKYRVYVYGSHDTQGAVIPCGFDQVVWSAPVEDLTKWRYDGVSFITGDYDGTANLYAPDVCEIVNDDGTKTYYLYPNATSSKQYYRVAKSDRPDGPFKVCEWSSENSVDNDILRSDPAVFVDDDGRIYGYWGSSSKPLWVELDPETMATVKEGCTPKYNLPGVYDILDRNNNMQPRADYDPTLYNIVQDEHVNDWRFFEASSIRKVGNKYVFIFCRYAPDTEPTGGYFSQLAYGYSDSPEGPWKYGGVIVRNAGEAIPNGDGTYSDTYQRQNTHGSICQIGDEWYVFYHRGHRGIISRQAMVEQISVEWDTKSVAEGGEVRIDFAEMTSKGFNTDGLDPYKTYSAGISSYITGNYLFTPNYSKNASFLPIISIHNGVVAGVKYFNFSNNAPKGHSTTLSINVTPKGVVGTIDVYLRPTTAVGTPIVKAGSTITSVGEGSYKIGSFKIEASMPAAPTTLTMDASAVDSLEGEWGVFFVFNTPSSYQLCDFNTLTFGADSDSHTDRYTDLGNGMHSHDCALCGKVLSAPALHSFESGECSLCHAEYDDTGDGIGLLYGYKVTLGSKVGFNFYMILSEETLADDGAYMSFKIGGREISVPLDKEKSATVDGVICYIFTAELDYHELSDKVTAKLVSAAGESKTYTYSVKEYAGYILKNAHENEEYFKAASLTEAMLNYGAYSQKYLNHSTSNLANSECAKKEVSSVTAKTFEQYRIKEAQGGKLVSPAGSGLTLEGGITLRLYFNIISDGELKFTLNGKELELGTKDEYKFVEIAEISPKNVDSDIIILVSDGETTEKITYNSFAYCHMALSTAHESFTDSLRDAMRALYLYNKALNEYN